ncbi:bifunctional (p)ppGpp synthetase/guanosine-3',5'-bis(diphosphate) 3'-pyrophosphohydrolase [bacterium]|nr:bifunctional (p)ppGpp synthetase/guanosine-3',5'-bis(diphosphate) 3'-pyrophosphohydrolase [candidate division CSSED10-310 bacterium]
MSREKDEQLQQLLDILADSHPDEDLTVVETAYKFARKAHKGQMRRDNVTEYFSHPYEVAKMAAEFKMDAVSVAAALLHDTLEDADSKLGVTPRKMRKLFGDEVMSLVNGLTKLKSQPGENPLASKGRTLMFLLGEAARNDARILVIKIFDRYHNIQSLNVFRKDKQLRIARETVKFYIPLADRLGLFEINRRMENLAFKNIFPEEYEALEEAVRARDSVNAKEFRQLEDMVRLELARRNVEFGKVRIFARHLYEIHSLLRDGGYLPSQIDEVAAYNLEIIVANEQLCFLTLFVVHNLFTHLPLMIKDFICNPKINEYRSLHSVIRVPSGKKIQCMIRTQEMADHGFHGIITKLGREKDRRLGWLNEDLVKNLDEVQSETITDLTKRLFFPEIDVFTPQGQSIKLPEGSTALDFAYHIHTDIGNQAEDALINGKEMSLGTILRSGDRVMIRTDVDVTPKVSWLGVVRTERAKLAVKRGLRRFDERTPEAGWTQLVNFLHRFQFAMNKTHKRWDRITADLGYASLDQLCRDVFYGRFFYQHILSFLVPYLDNEELRHLLSYMVSRHLVSPANEPDFTRITGDTARLRAYLAEHVTAFLREHHPPHPLIGLENIRFPMPVSIKLCCRPFFQDDIVALLIRERGAAVHKKSCGNIRHHLEFNAYNLVPAFWKREPLSSIFEFHILGEERRNLLKDIIDILSYFNISLTSQSMTITDGSRVMGTFTMRISELTDTEAMLERVRALDSVTSVTIR